MLNSFPYYKSLLALFRLRALSFPCKVYAKCSPNSYGKLLSMSFYVYIRTSLTIVYRELRMQKEGTEPNIRTAPSTH